MSELYMHKFVGRAWDKFCQSDDHIVPDPGNKRLDGHFMLGVSHKKRHSELVSDSSNTRDRSAARYVDQEGDQDGIPPLRKRRNTMLEKDSWPHTPDSPLTSAFNSDPVKEASNISFDSTMLSTHGLKSNNRNSNSGEFGGLDTILDDNDIKYFENAENKDSIDLLYCDWPEIENFEDIDSMFRNCESTFDLGVRREDDMGWLSSDDTGGSGNVLRSNVKFPYLEPNEVENISENHEFSNSFSVDDSAMISAPIRYKDSSWTSEKSDSCRSFVMGPDIADCKDGFIPQEQVDGSEFNINIQPTISTNSHSRSGSASVTSDHKNQISQEMQSKGKSKEHYLGNYILPCEVGKLSSGLTSHQILQSVHMQQQLALDSYGYSQNSISNMHSNNSHLSDPSSVNPKLYLVKSETSDLTSISPRDSSHASNQLQYMEGSPDPGIEATALPMCERRKKLHCRQGNLSSLQDSLKDGCVTVQASMNDPGLGRKYENHFNAAELGSSNIQERSTMRPDMDDIFLEAASFCQQLQLVMEKLDFRTKLCIRDSLYRLAQSAEQRHNRANLSAGCGEGDDETNRYTTFMDMETDTNPIDRSVAHLLFHQSSDSSTNLVQDSFPFKSSSVVIGPATSPPVLANNLVREGNVSEVEEVTDEKTLV
ncbi:hypothetical protein ACS0TY_007010 [Phlomoides rotata]